MTYRRSVLPRLAAERDGREEVFQRKELREALKNDEMQIEVLADDEEHIEVKCLGFHRSSTPFSLLCLLLSAFPSSTLRAENISLSLSGFPPLRLFFLL